MTLIKSPEFVVLISIIDDDNWYRKVKLFATHRRVTRESQDSNPGNWAPDKAIIIFHLWSRILTSRGSGGWGGRRW